MMKHTFIGVAGAVALTCAWLPAGADTLQDVKNAEASANQQLVQAQEQVDNLDDQTSDLVADYREVIAEIETLKTYNGQVQKLIDQQNGDISLLDKQINSITLTKRQIMPLIQSMLDSLRDFVQQDLPFRQQDRLSRIAALEALMTDPEVAESERYRLVLERYKIEDEYGRTLEAWSGNLDPNNSGTGTPANFLRLGRISLMAQTQGDNGASYWWDQDAGAWTELSSSYDDAISQGILMAEKAAQIDVIQLPVPAPKEAK